MEGIDGKLNLNNPVVTSQVFSKLIQIVQRSHEKVNKPNVSIPELNFIKEKCLHPDMLVSEVAVTSIIYLIESRVLQVKDILADFIAMIPMKRNCPSLSNIIGNLLYLEMKEKLKSDNKYECLYNLYFPQHPFVLLLNEGADCYRYIHKEIKNFYFKDDQIKLFASQLFRPVYLYTICGPSDSDTIIKQKLWSLVLNYEDIKATSILLDLFCWIQVETFKNLEVNSELLCEALNKFSSNSNTSLTELLLLMVTSLLYHLSLKKLDVRTVTYNLKKVLKTQQKNLITINCVMLILAKSIYVCSSVHLIELLEICEILVTSENTEFYALEALKVSLIYWIGNPSILTNSATKIANRIFTIIEDKCQKPLSPSEPLLSFEKHFRKVITSNSEMFTSIQLCLTMHNVGYDNILMFLKKLEESSVHFIVYNFSFICGLFTHKYPQANVTLRALSLLLKCIDHQKGLSLLTTTLILYKLANTKNNELHFELLKTLPKMVILQENMPKVVSTIQALSKGSSDLHNFCTKLMLDAWHISNKCFPYLESMLLTTIDEKLERILLERNIVKAHVFKELCEKRPELHGKDLVSHLSKILNECNDSSGAVPCALAIEGISTLCQAQVIDVVTTWANLSPKFKEDTRIPVIKSLCQLISEIPQLSYTEQYTELISQVVDTLWEYVVQNQYSEEDETIVDAALTALSSFKLEDICLHMPPNFIENDKEREFCLINKPLPMLSGGTWVCLQHNCYSHNATSKFVTKLMSDEIAGYLKYVYQVKGHKEPHNYNYLPRHSIVRGICNYVKEYMDNWKNLRKDDPHYLEAYRNCVKILSHEYSKPLPPLDWCFLQELMHEPSLKTYCIEIASHQVVISGSARRLMENFVVVVTENLDPADTLSIYKNLKHLANSLQPTILKPFFERTIERAITEYKESKKELLISLIDNLSAALKNQDIQPTNKNTIAQVLKECVFITDVNSEVFHEIIQCIPYLPSKKLEEITQCSSESFDQEVFLKTAQIRFLNAVTLKMSPLNWINDIVEVGSKTERDTSIFKDLMKVFKENIDNSESAVWLLEFFGQIQAKVADRCDTKEVSYFYDILILAVVVFSGYFVFLTENGSLETEAKHLFPQALSALMDVNHWSICTTQALEWLYHMNSEEIIPVEYRNIFGLALCSLRHDEEFAKNLRWLKYLNCKFDR